METGFLRLLLLTHNICSSKFVSVKNLYDSFFFSLTEMEISLMNVGPSNVGASKPVLAIFYFSTPIKSTLFCFKPNTDPKFDGDRNQTNVFWGVEL